MSSVGGDGGPQPGRDVGDDCDAGLSPPQSRQRRYDDNENDLIFTIIIILLIVILFRTPVLSHAVVSVNKYMNGILLIKKFLYFEKIGIWQLSVMKTPSLFSNLDFVFAFLRRNRLSLRKKCRKIF